MHALLLQVGDFALEHNGATTGHKYLPLTHWDELGEWVDTSEASNFWNELRIVVPLADPEPEPEQELLPPEPENFDSVLEMDSAQQNLRVSSAFAATIGDMQDRGRRCCCKPDTFVQVVLYLVADRILQFDSSAYRKALDRIWSTNLVFLMVGYVFLVSTSLEPMSCIQDLNKRWYMIAHPQQQCNWCEANDFLDKYAQLDFSADVPYPVLAGTSIFIASIYGLGIPILFYYIMYSHAHDWEADPASKDYGKLKTANLKKWKFVRRYGFLTSKTSEKYYYWEVMIIIRKLMLSLITKGIIIKNQKSDPNSGARQALCNMFVLVIACTAQAYALPFAHKDANFAESGLLLCAVLLVLVGMGTREVHDDTGRHIDDPPEVEKKLSSAESGMFYVTIYSVMIIVILGTLAIIMRRVGSLLHQVRVGRQRDGRKLSIQRSGRKDQGPITVTLVSPNTFKLSLEHDKTSNLPKVKKLDEWMNTLSRSMRGKLIAEHRRFHNQTVTQSSLIDAATSDCSSGNDADYSKLTQGYYLALTKIGNESVSEKKLSSVEAKLRQNAVLMQLVKDLEGRGIVGQHAASVRDVLLANGESDDQLLKAVQEKDDAELQNLIKETIPKKKSMADSGTTSFTMAFEWVKEEKEEDVDEADMALPDLMSELIHKSHLDAASAWFNEKRGDRYKRDGKCIRLFEWLRNGLPKQYQLLVLTFCGVLLLVSIGLATLPWFLASVPFSPEELLTDQDKLKLLGCALIPLVVSVVVYSCARHRGQNSTGSKQSPTMLAHSKLFIGAVNEKSPEEFRPSPGHIAQFKTRLMRLPGVFNVTVDDEDCTITVEYDLADVDADLQDKISKIKKQRSQDHQDRHNIQVLQNARDDDPKLGYPKLKQRATNILEQAAKSVVPHSRVFETHSGELPHRGILSGTLIFIGGCLVLLFQISTQLDCGLATTTPMNCSVYQSSFDNKTNPVAYEDPVAYENLWLMESVSGRWDDEDPKERAKAWNSENRTMDSRDFLDKHHGISNDWSGEKNPCNASQRKIETGGLSFGATCTLLGTVGRGCYLGRNASLEQCTFEPRGRDGPLLLPQQPEITNEQWNAMQRDSTYCDRIRVTLSNGDPVQPAFQKYCDLEFYWHTTLKHKCTQAQACIDFSVKGKNMKLWELTEIASRCAVCNFGRVIAMVIAAILCSVPLLINVGKSGWTWLTEEVSDRANSEILPDSGHKSLKEQFLLGILSLAAVGALIAIHEYGSAAAVAALFTCIGAVSRRAKEQAWKATVASIARLQKDDSSAAGRVSILRSADSNKLNSDFEVLRDAIIHFNIDVSSTHRTSCCGAGRKELDTVTLIHSCLYAGAGLGGMIWGLVLFFGTCDGRDLGGNCLGHAPDPVRLIQAAAVLLVSAKPRALAMSKSAPYWCSVAKASRAGFSNEGHLKSYLTMVVGGLSKETDYNDDFVHDLTATCELRQTLRRTTIINIVAALLFKLLSIVFLVMSVATTWPQKEAQPWWAVPWYALLIELFVTMFVIMLSTRCVRPALVPIPLMRTPQLLALSLALANSLLASICCVVLWVGGSRIVASGAVIKNCSITDGRSSLPQAAVVTTWATEPMTSR